MIKYTPGQRIPGKVSAIPVEGKVYLVGTYPYVFRTGIPALITGVKWVTPENRDRRLCYQLEWDDGVVDTIPVEERENYDLLTFEELR